MRERAIPVSISASRDLWLGVMSTVEKTKPVTGPRVPPGRAGSLAGDSPTLCHSPLVVPCSGVICIRKTRSVSGESQGNSHVTRGARPVRRSAIARSIWSRDAWSAMASKIERPSRAPSSASWGAPLVLAKRDHDRFALVMRPSRSTV